MALSADTVVEVRSGGSDTNGGGFVTGASGTDWSLQDAAQYSVTDAVTAGTTTITSATANFGTDVVGNLLYIQGGTGAVAAGWYQIISRTNSTTIVVDRSTGLTAGTGCTLKIGGAMATIQAGINICTVDAMTCYVKATSGYTITSALTFSARAGGYTTRLIGYTTTRGDGVKPVVTISGNVSGATLNSGWIVSNLTFDGAGSSSVGVVLSNNFCSVFNCWVKNFAGGGINAVNTGNGVGGCEVSGCGGIGGIVSGSYVKYCYVHDNTATGITCNVTSGNVVESNSGASSHGIAITVYPSQCVNNTIYNNGGSGIRLTNTFDASIAVPDIRNNLITNNGGYGIISVTAPDSRSRPWIRSNAFRSNTSGSYGTGFVADASDVTLTADPFVDGPNGNFALNNTAGGGAACRAAGYPGVFPGALSTGYCDIGAIQHQDSGGGGGASPIGLGSPVIRAA